MMLDDLASGNAAGEIFPDHASTLGAAGGTLDGWGDYGGFPEVYPYAADLVDRAWRQVADDLMTAGRGNRELHCRPEG
jgi:hypothetical protein